MAEFVETMKQAYRICGCHTAINKDYCEDCLLATENGGCMFDPLEKIDPEIIERRVVKWAEEHPEPVYPNLNEAWINLFPDSLEVPCPKRLFGEDYYPIFVCTKHDCAYCKAMPMHPEIAKKLGIRPIEIKKPASCGTCKYRDKSVWEAPCGTCKRAHGDCYPDQREEENDAEVH